MTARFLTPLNRHFLRVAHRTNQKTSESKRETEGRGLTNLRVRDFLGPWAYLVGKGLVQSATGSFWRIARPTIFPSGTHGKHLFICVTPTSKPAGIRQVKTNSRADVLFLVVLRILELPVRSRFLTVKQVSTTSSFPSKPRGCLGPASARASLLSILMHI